MHIETKELRKALKVFDLLGESKIKFEVQGLFLNISNVRSKDSTYYLEIKIPVHDFAYDTSIEIELKSLINFIKTFRYKLIFFYTFKRIETQYLSIYSGDSEYGIILDEINNKEWICI